MTLFYIDSLDLSDPNGNGSLEHTYQIQMLGIDVNSGKQANVVVDVVVKNPCVDDSLVFI